MAGVGKRTITAVTTAAILALAAADSALGQESSRGGAASQPQVTLAKTQPAASGVRFFTINEVLRQRDARSGTTTNEVPRQRDMSRPGTPAAVRIASIDVVSLRGSLSDVPATAYATPPKAGPFGTSTFRAPEGLLWEKWRKVEAQMRDDGAVIARCRHEPPRCPTLEARRVSSIVETVEARSGRARLDEVNRSVNESIRYTSDFAQHGVPDVWSAALASFSSGRGDCEDYAIAKYAILRAAGIPADDLKILLVRDTSAREPHAVLAVQADGKWLILDNRRSEIAEDRAIGYFIPLFTLDHQGVSLLAQSYATLGPAQHTPSGEDASPLRDEVAVATPASGHE